MKFGTKSVFLPAAIAAILLVSIGGCADRERDSELLASVNDLKNNPSHFDGKDVVVRGYLSCLLNMHLYPTKEQADIGEFTAISVSQDGEGDIWDNCCGSYVQVTGQFQVTKDLLNSIAPVTVVEKLTIQEGKLAQRDVCWAKTE